VFTLIYAVVGRLLSLIVLRGRGEASKDVELVLSRHEISVLRRHVPRPRLEPADRMIMAAFTRSWPLSYTRSTLQSVCAWRPAQRRAQPRAAVSAAPGRRAPPRVDVASAQRVNTAPRHALLIATDERASEFQVLLRMGLTGCTIFTVEG
jgi:hypothetical protein